MYCSLLTADCSLLTAHWSWIRRRDADDVQHHGRRAAGRAGCALQGDTPGMQPGRLIDRRSTGAHQVADPSEHRESSTDGVLSRLAFHGHVCRTQVWDRSELVPGGDPVNPGWTRGSLGPGNARDVPGELRMVGAALPGRAGHLDAVYGAGVLHIAAVYRLGLRLGGTRHEHPQGHDGDNS